RTVNRFEWSQAPFDAARSPRAVDVMAVARDFGLNKGDPDLTNDSHDALRQGTTRPLHQRHGKRNGKMANHASLDLLAYLLSLVVLEANSLNASELAADPEDPPSQD